MRFTRSWLAEHLEHKESDKNLCERLTAIGLEVEDFLDPADSLAGFRVARVLECKRHPHAEKLKLCLVRFDEKSEPLQVVCGAHNVRKDFLGVFAPIASVIPATQAVLKAAKIQGEASQGMLLSEYELGISDDHEGIIELGEEEQNWRIGDDFAQAAGLIDPIFTIAITPNRADCLGVRGIARDLAAAGIGSLKPLRQPKLKETSAPPIASPIPSPITWRIDLERELASHCPFVCGRYFRDLKNLQAPKYARARLKAIGIKSISALVDMTNYMTIDLARPLHVFDAKKINGTELTIRKAKKNESLLALDNKRYELPKHATVIADQKEVVGIGGIIGGLDSGCDENTNEVFLECALFDARATAKTGRELNINSDARFRFERGLDSTNAQNYCDIASSLLLEWCGGQASQIVMAGAMPEASKKITLASTKVKKLGGIELPQKRVEQILTTLGFVKERSNAQETTFSTPSWREDVTTPECLVEEVLRIEGYDMVPYAPFLRQTPLTQRAISASQKRDCLVRRRLAMAGLDEVITWSFIDSRIKSIFALDEGLRLQNPISAYLDSMRPSLLPNLMATVAQNIAQDKLHAARKSPALFELGPRFIKTEQRVEQEQVAAGIRTSPIRQRHWQSEQRDVNAFDAKADLRAVLNACGLDSARLDSQLSQVAPEGYHPTRYGIFCLGRTTIGQFGEIHPELCEHFDLSTRIVAFEVFLDRLPRPKNRIAAKPWQRQKQQSIYRDFAFWITKERSAAEVKQAVLRQTRNRVNSLNFFDQYQPDTQKERSLAFEVEILPANDRPRDEEEVRAISQEIVSCLESLGCRMREG